MSAIAEASPRSFFISASSIKAVSVHDLHKSAILQGEGDSLIRALDRASGRFAQIYPYGPVENAIEAEYSSYSTYLQQQKRDLTDQIAEGHLSYEQVLLCHALIVGGTLLLDEVLNKRLQIAHKKNIEKAIAPFTQVDRFYSTGSVHVPIAGISITDLLYPDIFARYPLSALLEFIVTPDLILKKLSHDITPPVSPDRISSDYPNLARNNANIAICQMSSLLSLTNSTINQYVDKNRKNPLEIAVSAQTIKVIEQINLIRQKIINAIISPDESSADLTNKLESYLSQHKDVRLVTMNALLAASSYHIKHLYWAACTHISQGNNVPFYTQLKNVIKEYVGELPAELGIFTEDYLPATIGTQTIQENEDTPTLTQLGETASTISLMRIRRANYKIVLKSHPAIPIINPDSIVVQFYPNKLNEFTIIFNYKIGDKSTEIIFHVDPKTDFSWSFIEQEYDSPGIANAHKALMISAHTILEEVKRQLDRGTPATHVTNPQVTVRVYPVSPSAPAQTPNPNKRHKSNGSATPAEQVQPNSHPPQPEAINASTKCQLGILKTILNNGQPTYSFEMLTQNDEDDMIRISAYIAKASNRLASGKDGLALDLLEIIDELRLTPFICPGTEKLYVYPAINIHGKKEYLWSLAPTRHRDTKKFHSRNELLKDLRRTRIVYVVINLNGENIVLIEGIYSHKDFTKKFTHNHHKYQV